MDIVYLKNGSIIRGVIIEQVPNKSIKIETADESVFVFQMDEVQKLTREPMHNPDFQSSYKGIVQMGYQISDRQGLDRLKINIINGYQISPYFSLGLGTGLRYYGARLRYYSPSSETLSIKEIALIPIFTDIRANYRFNNVSPYLSFGIGHSFDFKNSFKYVGIIFNPTAGVAFMITDKSAVKFGIGYEMQGMGTSRYYIEYFDNLILHYGNSHAFSINIGISF